MSNGGGDYTRAYCQVENVLLAKIASINSPYFDFNACDFSERNMHAKDRNDPDATKEGSGRVALYRTTNLTHLYTCESHYVTTRILNVMVPIKEREEKDAQRVARVTSPPSKSREPAKFEIEAFARCVSIVVCALSIRCISVERRELYQVGERFDVTVLIASSVIPQLHTV